MINYLLFFVLFATGCVQQDALSEIKITECRTVDPEEQAEFKEDVIEPLVESANGENSMETPGEAVKAEELHNLENTASAVEKHASETEDKSNEADALTSGVAELEEIQSVTHILLHEHTAEAEDCALDERVESVSGDELLGFEQ